MAIDQEKMKVYEVLTNLGLKALLVIVAVVILVVLFWNFIDAVKNEEYLQAKYFGAGSGTLFVGIVIMVYKHFFPSKK